MFFKAGDRKVNIVVAGAGYVGLPNALAMARYNPVTIVEPDKEKVKLISEGISPLPGEISSDYFHDSSFDLQVTSNGDDAYKDADYIFIATPTDYNKSLKELDTSSVREVIEKAVGLGTKASIVIKSTVPVGFTKAAAEKTGYPYIFFSPEFLREGQALHDCLYPSRVIVGAVNDSADMKKRACSIMDLFCEAIKQEDPEKMIVGSSEAEAIKLFSNTYLALRISFFNELDSFAQENGLDAKDIINGVGMDSRIGSHYNNPSFGYGGYCLPKDTMQIRSQFSDASQELISAVIDSNEARKNFVVSQITKHAPGTVGVFRLAMKKDSRDFRSSSVIDVMNKLCSQGIKIVIYEPLIKEEEYGGFEVINDIEKFACQCDIILANRLTPAIEPYAEKVYSRDLFGRG